RQRRVGPEDGLRLRARHGGPRGRVLRLAERQVARRFRGARPVARHGRRGARPAEARGDAGGQRAGPAARRHRSDDLQRRGAGGVRVPADDVGARRRPVHRDAVRGGTGIGGVPVRRRRDDGPRDRARKPGEPRPLSGPVAGAGSRPPPRRGQVMTIRSVRTRAGRARRCAAAALGGVLAAGALAACSSDPTRKSSGDTGVLNMYLYQKPKTFSPLAPNTGPDQLVMSFVFDSLYGVDGSYELKPHLAAAAPEVSDDAKTITFKLKAGLKWSDGEPLTSKDVVFTSTRSPTRTPAARRWATSPR